MLATSIVVLSAGVLAFATKCGLIVRPILEMDWDLCRPWYDCDEAAAPKTTAARPTARVAPEPEAVDPLVVSNGILV